MNKKFNFIIMATMTVMLMAGSLFTSCKKVDTDQSGDSLPAAGFTLTAEEDRFTYFNFPWTISKAGVTDSVNEDSDKMYVTKYNTVTLVVKPSSPASFQGVNVRSSNAAAVRVTKLDETHYDLSYLKDGEADISVWNGGKNDEIRTTFHVTAKDAIYPTAAVFVLDEGTENETEVRAKEWFVDEKTEFFRYYDGFINVHKPLDYRSLYKTNAFDIFINANEGVTTYPPKVLHTIRFKTLEPENTSFRNLIFASSKYNECAYKDWKEYLQSENLSTDWWDSWTGDYKDFNKTCYYAKVTSAWGLWDFSICELTFMANRPAGSPWCQTAVIMNTQNAW